MQKARLTESRAEKRQALPLLLYEERGSTMLAPEPDERVTLRHDAAYQYYVTRDNCAMLCHGARYLHLTGAAMRRFVRLTERANEAQAQALIAQTMKGRGSVYALISDRTYTVKYHEIRSEKPMINKEQIEAYIDSKEQEYLEALARLIAIPSERSEPEDGAPYGKEPLRAMEEAISIAKEWGLDAKNWENTVATVDLLEENDDHLHILAHLDVVPAGENWTRPPYELTQDDKGNIYGRGVSDDKGPALAALLALRAVKELGVPLKKNCRLILGTDEESGFSDINRYYGEHPFAAYSFTPDADYPVINTEKGHYNPFLTKSWTVSDALPRVERVQGGLRRNVVPPKAQALVLGMTVQELAPYVEAAQTQTKTVYTLTALDGGTQIACQGTNGHAAHPEAGNNAITALLALLAALPLAQEDEGNRTVCALARLFPHGDYAGKAIGVAQEDAISGALTLSFNICNIENGKLHAQFDARVPICANDENCRSIVEAACAEAGITLDGGMSAAHHVPADSPFIQTLLDALECFTGTRGEPLAIGGGTYVHDIPGGVAFGCTFPGTETNIHGADETTPLHELIVSAKIFALAIATLCG